MTRWLWGEKSNIYINGMVVWVARTPTSISQSYDSFFLNILHCVCLFLYRNHLLSWFGKFEVSTRKELLQITPVIVFQRVQCKRNFFRFSEMCKKTKEAYFVFCKITGGQSNNAHNNAMRISTAWVTNIRLRRCKAQTIEHWISSEKHRGQDSNFCLSVVQCWEELESRRKWITLNNLLKTVF